MYLLSLNLTFKKIPQPNSSITYTNVLFTRTVFCFQEVVAADEATLSQLLNMDSEHCRRIHRQCQRYLDECQESQEALDLLQILKQSQNSQSQTGQDTETMDQTDGQVNKRSRIE